MLAWAMNGEPLPAFHGFPLRMLAPGFPGSAQGKWLRRLWVRDREHDGLGMLGKSYRVPKYPLRPGDYDAPDEIFKVFTQQPVRSLIVRPARCTVTRDPHLVLHGKAWSGAGEVVRVELSYDAGRHWTNATLFSPANKWAWQEWVGHIDLPYPGVWDIFVRATDHTGAMQPMVVPGWNPGGYGNNQAMKVDVELLASTSQSGFLQEKCAVCGHTYNPKKDCGGQADSTKNCGEAGVPFEQLPKEWRCPVCGALKSAYHETHKSSSGEPPAAQQGIPFPDPVSRPPQSSQPPLQGWEVGPGVLVGVALAAFMAGFAIAKPLHITQLSGVVATIAGCLGAAGTARLASPSLDTLFAGHVYFMAAFFALLTLGLNIYPVCGAKGRGRSRGLHAGVQMVAAACGAAGYVCMYRSQADMGVSQLGLAPGLPWAMVAHVWCGYLVLALVAVQVFQGWSRLLGFGLHLRHRRLGQICFAGAAANMLLVYGFGLPGLAVGSEHSSDSVALGLVAATAVLTLVLSCVWKRVAAREVVPELALGEDAYAPLSGSLLGGFQ